MVLEPCCWALLGRRWRCCWRLALDAGCAAALHSRCCQAASWWCGGCGRLRGGTAGHQRLCRLLGLLQAVRWQGGAAGGQRSQHVASQCSELLTFADRSFSASPTKGSTSMLPIQRF